MEQETLDFLTDNGYRSGTGMKREEVETIKVKHFLTYTSNGCDCCEDTPWDNYEIDCLDRPFTDMESLMEAYLREVVGVEFEIEYEEDYERV